MVTICAPSRAPIGTEQDRIAVPLMCTVQAPHCAIPQPNFVPVKPRTSRKTQRSGVSGSMLICRDAPLTWIVITVALPPLQRIGFSARQTPQSPGQPQATESTERLLADH